MKHRTLALSVLCMLSSAHAQVTLTVQQKLPLPKSLLQQEVHAQYNPTGQLYLHDQKHLFVWQNNQFQPLKTPHSASFKGLHFVTQGNPVLSFEKPRDGQPAQALIYWNGKSWDKWGEVQVLGGPDADFPLSVMNDQFLQTSRGRFYLANLEKDFAQGNRLFQKTTQSWTALPLPAALQSPSVSWNAFTEDRKGALMVLGETRQQQLPYGDGETVLGLAAFTAFRFDGQSWTPTQEFPADPRQDADLTRDAQGNVLLAYLHQKTLQLQRWDGNQWKKLGSLPVGLPDFPPLDLEVAAGAHGQVAVVAHQDNVHVLYVLSSTGKLQTVKSATSRLNLAVVKSQLRVLWKEKNQLNVASLTQKAAQQPTPKEILVWDPRVKHQRGKVSPQQTRQLQSLVEKANQRYRAKNTECLRSVRFEVLDHLQGNFTRKGVKEDAYLYLYCLPGESVYNGYGLAVLQNGKLVAHEMAEGPAYALHPLPDLSGDGLQELGVVWGHNHMGEGSTSLDIFSFAPLKQLITLNLLENNCGSDGPYQSTAKRITVLPGKPLQFYQQTHQDQTPCQDTSNWTPRGKPERVKP